MNDKVFHAIYVLCAATIVCIIASIIFTVWPSKRHVSYSEVRHAVLQNNNNLTTKLVLPPAIKSWNEGSLKVLNGWLKGLSEKEAQHFINNLHDIIDQAQQDPTFDINSIVNTYKQIYLEKIGDTQTNALNTTFKMIFVIVGILVIVLIGILFCVISITMNVRDITDAVIDIDQMGANIHDKGV